MKKKQLLQMRRLYATSKMVRVAQQDIPQKVTVRTYWNSYQEVRRKYQIYLRCRVDGGILKAALYYPDNLRADGRMPSYEVYIDRDAGRFITYDCINKKWLDSKLDRLEWPHYVPASPRAWAIPAEAKAAAEYLGSEKMGYEAILDYQLEIRKEERIRRHERETSKWDADLALTPPLPKDWARWVDKVGIPENYIFYEYQKRGAKSGHCSYCEKEVPLKSKPHNNEEGRCPICRHKITYKSVGRMGWRLDTKEVCVYLLQARPDGFIVREFWAGRRYLKESYKHPEVFCTEHWRVIYDNKMDARTYYWGNYKQLCTRWIGGLPNYSWMGPNSIYCTHGNQPGRVYGRNLPYLAKGVLKSTGLVEWIRAHGFVENPDTYLSVLRHVPQFERIWKAGLTRLAEECWRSPRDMARLIANPQSTSLTKALGIDKQGLGRLRLLNGDSLLLRWLQWEKENGKPLSDEVLKWFYSHEIEPSHLSFILGKMNPIQIYHYLERQASTAHETVRETLTTWQDYLSMAQRLGIDTNDEIVYRAKLLRRRHDELVLRCKQADNEQQARDVLKTFPTVDKICQSIKDKYEYANEQFTIVVPTGVLDIIVEGEMLCHCLRGSDRYWDRIEKHESYILFLRKTSAVNMPYYTLEVEPDGTVRQKRTKFDRQEADIEDAKKFLVEWQGVLANRLTKNDRMKAENSKVLREQEFEQMRRDNIIIHTGELYGQRLVDVLTADLMEAAA